MSPRFLSDEPGFSRNADDDFPLALVQQRHGSGESLIQTGFEIEHCARFDIEDANPLAHARIDFGRTHGGCLVLLLPDWLRGGCVAYTWYPFKASECGGEAEPMFSPSDRAESGSGCTSMKTVAAGSCRRMPRGSRIHAGRWIWCRPRQLHAMGGIEDHRIAETRMMGNERMSTTRLL